MQLASSKRAKDNLTESLAAAGEKMAEQARALSETSAALAKSQRECAAANSKLGNLGHELDRTSDQVHKLTGASKERDDARHELELAKSQLERYLRALRQRLRFNIPCLGESLHVLYTWHPVLGLCQDVF